MSTVKRTGFGEQSAVEVYNKLKQNRAPYETRANNCAEVTIPSLFPKESDNASTDYKTPYQSVGARGLNNLAAKLMMALFPTETWLRLNISEYEAKALLQDPDALAQVDQGLSMVERTIMNYFEVNSYRVPLFEGIKQALIAGNFLVYIPEPETKTPYNPIKIFKLLSFVVQRDSVGQVMQIVCREKIGFAMLPEDVQQKINDQGYESDSMVEIYTHIYWDPESQSYLKYEEVESEEIEGTDAQYPKDSCPYIPVRMIRIDGEDYGRSYCEEYLGDLNSLEKISRAILEITVLSAKVINLVNPTGLTSPRRLNKAANGEYVTGRAEDINQLLLNKISDFSIAAQMSDKLEERLGQAFLLNSSVQRNAERVTAEEIRYVAKELESVLGGVYSILTQELQLPMVRVALRQLQATKKVPNLPKEAVNPVVTTGIDAMGRGQDLEKLTSFIAAIEGVQTLANDPSINMTTLKIRLANALGIDTAGLVRTDEEIQQERAKQAQQQAMMSAAQTGGAGIAQQATASPEAMQNTMANIQNAAG